MYGNTENVRTAKKIDPVVIPVALYCYSLPIVHSKNVIGYGHKKLIYPKRISKENLSKFSSFQICYFEHDIS